MSREHPARIKSSVMGSMVWFIGLVVFLFPPGAPVKAAAAPKRVLALYWYNKDFPSNAPFDRSLQAVLKTAPAGSIEYYTEYLESDRFPGENQSEALRDYLRQKYASRFIDVVVAVSDVPLDFLLKYRDSLFTKTPIVFIAIKRPATNETSGPGLTGIVLGGGYKKTLDLALRLHTSTKHVFIISGTLNHDKTYETLCREELQGLDSGISINYFTDLSVDELIFKTKHLPERSVVLYIWQQSQNEGRLLESADILAAIAPSTTAPIYGVANWQVGRGVVGGYLRTFEADGTRVGEIALRIVNGARAQNIPIESATKTPIFDWGQLHRWGLKESALPPGSMVLYREPTLWERNRNYILAGLGVIVAQTFLIAGLLWQRTRRRKAELKLGKSEEKFSKAFRQSPFAITIASARDGCYIDVNETFETQTGWKRDEIIGRTPGEINLWVNPDQRTAFVRELVEKGNIRDLEVLLCRKDGEIRTSLGSAELIEVNGEPCALWVIADITERKLAEEAISGFSRRLIEAQETERTRIARELHDDINQRLAMVAVGLKTLRRDLADSDQKTSRRIEEATAQVSELESDIQALSHRLHSSKLEYLGIEVAASSFCREVSERNNVKVDFRGEGIPEDLSSEVSLCLFRVLQEAVHNAVKYSGVEKFEVSLTGREHEIQLRVHDSGAGFDAMLASIGHGLGLTSMKERLRLVSGELSIDSKPGHGTTVLARVPRVEERSSAGAAA
jgi:PAS domain S-box-containing protein